jgi:2,3-bisphosphoglycerate-dependent phosphoglycerate mutase
VDAQTWPDRLLVVRHGESSGNVARDLADAQGQERIDIAERDMDVPLSDLGRRQSEALGHWIARLPADERPTALWTSPYVRARQTADLAVRAAGLDLPTVVDERLREREFGVLDALTRKGIIALFPEESERRTRLGKYYHRPPGGESWADVLLRLRAAVEQLRRDSVGERVLVVAHQVVVLLIRGVVEQLDEQQVLALDAEAEVANCAVCSFRLEPDAGLLLDRWNEVAPLEQDHEQVTREPDEPGAPR